MPRLNLPAFIFTLVLVFAGLGVWTWFSARGPQGTLETAECPVIAEVSRRPLGETDYSGQSVKEAANGFHDDFLFDRDGKFKIGAREEWGGAIVFFGAEGANALDASEAGRGAHLAFHDDFRARQGCAYNESCARKDTCPAGPEFAGWLANQPGDKCGRPSGVLDAVVGAELRFLFSPRLANPAWSRKDCRPTADSCADPKLANNIAPLRISQSIRFVRPGIAEVEVFITNLIDRDIITKNGELNELPVLFAANGKSGDRTMSALKNSTGEIVLTGNRTPANYAGGWQEFPSPGGWAAYTTADSLYGVGVYWESRPSSLRAEQIKGDYSRLTTRQAMILPALETVRARYYLIVGSFAHLQEEAVALDKALPPFGRIDDNSVREDARTVHLNGWVLDNKQVTALELWVDGKKSADLKLETQRDDVCATYPGYTMCSETHSRVGFDTTYARPNGTGCERPVEVRAQDSDGNWRVIARRSVSPVVLEN